MKIRKALKGPGVAALAAAVAIATVSPLGAFTAGGTGRTSDAVAAGRAYSAVISAVVEQAVKAVAAPKTNAAATSSDGSIADAVRRSVQSHLGSGAAASSSQTNSQRTAQQLTSIIEDVTLPSLPLPSLQDEAEQAEAQEQQMSTASTQDVINALLALLNAAQPDVLDLLAQAEAALLAKIDDAKAKAIAAFAQVDLGPTEAFVLSQIDFARVLVQQLFAQIRALVLQGFTAARNKIIEELTGVDFGDAVDDVLAEIAEIQQFVQNALAGVRAILDQVMGGLPSTGS